MTPARELTNLIHAGFIARADKVQAECVECGGEMRDER